jgi:Flp pilus assembly protein TadG
MRTKQKNRRGSVLVLVALMLGALMTVTAIAADIGRFYSVAGELQTAADAAALKGASVLQLTAANFESTVDDSVTAWIANTNRADGTTPAITADSVEVGYWTPGAAGVAGTFSPTPAGSRPNAVLVRAGGLPRGIFSQLIGFTGQTPVSRRAIAWIGNLSLDCTRPWALNYLPLVQAVNGNSDTTQSLDMTKFLAYQNLPPEQRVMIMHNSEVTTGNPPDNGVWTAYNLPSGPNGGGNSGSTTYQSQIAACNNIAMNSDAGNGNVQPSTGVGNCGAGTVVCWAIEAVDGMNQGQISGPGICAFQPGSATCFDSQGSAGVVTDITYGNVMGNGAGGIDFKYVGETTLLCFFRTTTDVCDAIPDPKAKFGYQPGTLVVVAQGLKSRTLNPTRDIVSNTPSNVQRFFLVR